MSNTNTITPERVVAIWLQPRLERLTADLTAYQISGQRADSRASRQRDEARVIELTRIIQQIYAEPKTPAALASRKRELARIHALVKELQVDDATHRSICRSVALSHCESSGQMLTVERRALIAHYNSKLPANSPSRSSGYRPRGGAKASSGTTKASAPGMESRPQVGQDRQALIGKVEALLAEKRRIEQTDYLSWRYADGMAKRLAKVDAVRFADVEGLRKIVAALRIHVDRIKTAPQGGAK